MSNDSGKRGMVKVSDRGLAFDTAEDGFRVAQLILKSGMAPRSFKTPEAILVAISYGRELGFAPVQALSMIAVVNGKPAVHSDGMPALVMRSGLLESMEVEEIGAAEDCSDWACVVTVKRKDIPSAFYGQFSMSDARRAGLASRDTWRQYPRRMLLARARTYALRDAFPDVLLGAVTADEVPPEPEAFPSGTTQAAKDLDAVMGVAPEEQPPPIEPAGVSDAVGPPVGDDPPLEVEVREVGSDPPPSAETPEERAEREAVEAAAESTQDQSELPW